MLQIAASAKVVQLRQAITAVVSATSVALLQAKQRLSFIGTVDTNLRANCSENSNSSHRNNNGNFEKRSGLEMPVKSNYCAPKLPIILCHGLFGFDKLGPSSIPYLQIHYWGGIQEALRKLGAKIVVTKVPRTGDVRARAQVLHDTLETVCSGGIDVNLLAHSMGGLDCRYLIAHLPTKHCSVRSLTTIATPHRGSPFMDWCRDNIGVAKSVEATAKAVDDAIKRIEDRISQNNSKEQSHSNNKPSPPYRENNKDIQQTLREMDENNPNSKENQVQKMNNDNNEINTPNHPSVAYYSYGAAMDLPIWSPLYFPHQIIKDKDGPNDGLVSIKSAQWGKYVRTVKCDHWDLTDRWRMKIGSNFDPIEFYLSVATFLASEGY
ncbi:19318_t:CDS:2 [Funneliformis geosporum]|uniref:5503_t:CDS:1 n=1 Tax=Funneliformis geosporum TaxID=1117311 RepID=A0A9W4WXU8_9GLOM|nr:19318_t:CDS:2 [Funneliformis geosporum]CAI2171671.1 5503_t:CDS:2 [Funneliformis geosporum]